MKIHHLQTPLDNKIISTLKAGDKILLSGIIYSARDKTHQELLKLNKTLPFKPKGQVIYYMGPTPTKKGQIIGSCGPTTSIRMDPYTEPLLKQGIKLTIGKGERSDQIKKVLQKYKSVYAITYGGTAAYLAQFIIKNKIIAFDDLGIEALRELEIKDFPMIVAYDIHGSDIFCLNSDSSD